LAAITAWAVALAQLWLMGGDAARPSRLRYAVWLVAAWAVTALLTQPVMMAYGASVQAPSLGMPYALLMPLLVFSSNDIVFGWLLLWILPLLAHYARGVLTRAPAWAFLDAPPADVARDEFGVMTPTALQPRTALLIGLAAGGLAMALLGLGRYLFVTSDADGASGAARMQQIGTWLMGGQLLLMLAAGAVTAARVRHFRITQGLFAASVVALCVGLLTFATRVGRPLAEISALDEALSHTRLLLGFGILPVVAACWLVGRAWGAQRLSTRSTKT
jgi:hypothetical protein